MRKGPRKKLERARKVCQGAGFLLRQLEMQFGSKFSEGMRLQVRQAINECNQQGAAMAMMAAEAERMCMSDASSTTTKEKT